MTLEEILNHACYSLHLKSDSKPAVIGELVGLLADGAKLPDASAALEAVVEREKKMSTGMQAGVAFPHGKTATVRQTAAAIALKKEGVDFSSLDGEPSRIFVMTVTPMEDTDTHMEVLAQLGKVLNEEPVRERLLAATSVDDMKKALLQASAPLPPAKPPTEA